MDQYKERLEKIEEQVMALMPASCDSSWMGQMTSYCPETLPLKMIDTFNAPGVELLERGGKRWRPLVMVLCCEAAGGNADQAYTLSPLVELPHNGSLIVDDIEDKSVERRGGDSVHLIYGDDISINAGNLMYFNATGIVRTMDLSPELKFQILDQYCENLRRLHLGQGLDIQWHNNHEELPNQGQYLQMCRFKTGALARFAGQAGILLATADLSLSEKVGNIWEQVGVGFQILDDIKNLSTGNPGKQRGDDIVEGKKSLPVILFSNSHKESYPKLKELMALAGQQGMANGVKYVEDAIKMLEEAGVLIEAGNIARAMLNEAMKDLDDLLPPSKAKDLQIKLVKNFLSTML